jgi:putative sporulation protein YyaC
MFDFSKKPVFVCIGTELHEADKIAPTIGSILKRGYKYDFKIYGVLGDNISKPNARERIEAILATVEPNEQIIAIDIGFNLSNSSVFIKKGGIRPSGYLDKTMPEIGDISIIINCAVGNIEDFMVNNFTQEEKDILDNRMTIALNLCEELIYLYKEV